MFYISYIVIIIIIMTDSCEVCLFLVNWVWLSHKLTHCKNQSFWCWKRKVKLLMQKVEGAEKEYQNYLSAGEFRATCMCTWLWDQVEGEWEDEGREAERRIEVRRWRGEKVRRGRDNLLLGFIRKTFNLAGSDIYRKRFDRSINLKSHK